MKQGDAGMDGGELVLTRKISAPRERVFDAWTDPVHIGQWWGPNGFITDTEEMAVRVGGTWRFTLHAPDGTDNHGRIVYTALQRPALLRYEQCIEGAPQLQVQVSLAPEGEATLLTLHLSCLSGWQQDGLARSGTADEARQTMERLERYLAGYGSEM